MKEETITIKVPVITISEDEIKSMKTRDLLKLARRLRKIEEEVNEKLHPITTTLLAISQEINGRRKSNVNKRFEKELKRKGYTILSDDDFGIIYDELGYEEHKCNNTIVGISDKLTVRANVKSYKGNKLIVVWVEGGKKEAYAVAKPEKLSEDLVKEVVAKVDKNEVKSLKVFNTLDVFKQL